MVLDIDLRALASYVFISPVVYVGSKIRYITYDAPLATWYWLTGKQPERITQPEPEQPEQPAQ